MGCVARATIDRTDRELDAPKETLDLNSHVVNQKLGDKKVAERLADEVVSQDSPVLSGVFQKGRIIRP